MANPTVLAGVVNDFTILQNQRVIDMNPVIQQIENDVAPLVVALTKAGNKPARSQTVQWLEDQLVPRRTTLAIAALIGDLTITVAASTGQFFRARDVLRFVNNGASTLLMRRARCSAPTDGKLHHTSPRPLAPSVSSTSTSSIGRSRIVPNDVVTSVVNGNRYTWAVTRLTPIAWFMT